jgi:integrase/recombinase XerD
VIQEISGHRSLASLQRYLEVSPEQKKVAIAVLSY